MSGRPAAGAWCCSTGRPLSTDAGHRRLGAGGDGAARHARADPAQLRAMVGPPLQERFAGRSACGAEVDRAVAAYRAHYAAGAVLRRHRARRLRELLATLRRGRRAARRRDERARPFAARVLTHAGCSGPPPRCTARRSTAGRGDEWSAWRWPRTRTGGPRCWSATGRRTCSAPPRRPPCIGAGWGRRRTASRRAREGGAPPDARRGASLALVPIPTAQFCLI